MICSGGFAILLSYLIPVAALVIAGPGALETDGRVQWTLRRWIRPVSIASTLFGAFILIILSFPAGYPIRAKTFSWAPVVFAGVFILTSLSWIIYGNGASAHRRCCI